MEEAGAVTNGLLPVSLTAEYTRGSTSWNENWCNLFIVSCGQTAAVQVFPHTRLLGNRSYYLKHCQVLAVWETNSSCSIEYIVCWLGRSICDRSFFFLSTCWAFINSDPASILSQQKWASACGLGPPPPPQKSCISLSLHCIKLPCPSFLYIKSVLHVFWFSQVKFQIGFNAD